MILITKRGVQYEEQDTVSNLILINCISQSNMIILLLNLNDGQ